MTRKNIAILTLLLLSAIPLGGAINAVDDVPAATLLLPYFEVDLANVNSTNTIFTIANSSSNATLAHVTLWTDRGVPTYGFDVYLGGYDVEEIDLRLLFNGIVPQTSPAASPAGAYSGPHVVFSACDALLAQGRIPAATVEGLRAAHTGAGSTLFGGNCAGDTHSDSKVRGYVTIDNVRSCSSAFPTTAGYFLIGGTGIATNDNVLWGEWSVQDRTTSFSYSETLVALEADAEDPVTDGVDPNDITFYARRIGSRADHREPLAMNWLGRFMFGAHTTTALVWRDHPPTSAFPCAAPPAKLSMQAFISFDEQENPVAALPSAASEAFGLASQSVDLGASTLLNIPHQFGNIFYETARPDALESKNQAFVTHVFQLNGRGRAQAGWPLQPMTDSYQSRLPVDSTYLGQCDDGIDNDGDGQTDFPADSSCRDAQSLYSAEVTECSDGLDNDGNGLIDYPADPKCHAAFDSSEWDNRQCDDGIDNDADGLIDYPADPRCLWPWNTSEAEGVCGDGIDNDGDSFIDYPADPQCESRYSSTENPECSDGIDNDLDGDVDYPADAGCLNRFSRFEGPACDDGIDNDGDGLADYPADPGCLSPSSTAENPQCSDGLDNDGDGNIDVADLGCTGPSDNRENDELCGDGIDNDGDGAVDFPNDSSCADNLDPSELPDCSDGQDNDGDGNIDFPVDPGCASAADLNEFAGTTTRECSDGIDNDGDGRIDFGSDTGCSSRYDDNEF